MPAVVCAPCRYSSGRTLPSGHSWASRCMRCTGRTGLSPPARLRSRQVSTSSPAQAALPPALPRERPLWIRVRALLRRLEHRTDADAGGGERHERHLDVRDRRPRPRPEAPARETRHRCAAGAGDRRTRNPDRPRALVGSRTHATDVRRHRSRGPSQPVGTTRRRETMTNHKIGTREEWLAAREQLLVREKEHTRLGDEIAQQRRELPCVQGEKEYRVETDDGEKTLVELFDGRSQLLVYHFMFGPSYDAGCPTCSSIADAVNGVLPHLHARDVTFVFVSQAPLEKLQAYKRRMGWSFPWVSSARTDFNLDLGFSRTEEQTREDVAPMMETALPPIVAHNASSTGTDIVGYLSEGFGFSTFVRDDGTVYHTYSTTARGVEFLMGYYPILDRAPKGRDEGDAWQVWIRRHDEYDSE